MQLSTVSEYPNLIILSNGKKSFKNMSNTVAKSEKYVANILHDSTETIKEMRKMAVKFFKNSNEVILAIDESLLRKPFSKAIHGAIKNFDQKIGREIMSFKLLASVITNGKYAMPFSAEYTYPKALASDGIELKNDQFKNIILEARKYFAHLRLIICADGAFATQFLLRWLLEQNFAAEMRMHRNRKVLYKGQESKLSDIKELHPKGRHKSKTIRVEWHEMSLYITSNRRIDKHGNETIVYQVSTYKAKPSKHVSVYKKRWPIEKMFRTTKQHLGLQECFSKKKVTQLNHVAAVLFSYAMLQIEQRKNHFKTPEEALRSLKPKKWPIQKRRISRLDQIFEIGMA